MRLTQHSDYALRLLMFAGLHPERVCTVGEAAAAYGISENHLMKMAFLLGRAGFLHTSRGRKGGVRLARPPSEINLGAVVRSTEPDLALVECFGPSNRCPIAGPCGLQGILEEALRAFLAVLDRSSLADLLRRPGALLRRLEPARAAQARARRPRPRRGVAS